MFQTYTYQKFEYKQSVEQTTQTVKRHPVVIIGAGPVGLTQALDLAHRGVSSIILDDDNTVSIDRVRFVTPNAHSKFWTD